MSERDSSNCSTSTGVMDILAEKLCLGTLFSEESPQDEMQESLPCDATSSSDGICMIDDSLRDSVTKDQQTTEEFKASASHKRHELEEVVVPAGSYFPVTQEIDLTDGATVLKVAEESSHGYFQASESCCLVGLHACGDLTVTALRLFTDLPAITALCVVGCCYHHITEKQESSGT